MKLYNTVHGILLEDAGGWHRIADGNAWSALINQQSLATYLRDVAARTPCPPATEADLLPPVHAQEVWAAGVTYLRSRDARVDESKTSGGSTFYARVYAADRPELFFKSQPHRVVSPGGLVRLRSDAKWTVPEPELALIINRSGAIVGYTIGNDMSSRDIEGENPLYLPQAKIYDGSCALGPCMLVAGDEPLAAETRIEISISRSGAVAFSGETSLSRMKRTPDELAKWLYRDQSFVGGCVLLTGTGIVPPDDFTLKIGDRIDIHIDSIGQLTNIVGG